MKPPKQMNNNNKTRKNSNSLLEILEENEEDKKEDEANQSSNNTASFKNNPKFKKEAKEQEIFKRDSDIKDEIDEIVMNPASQPIKPGKAPARGKKRVAP